MAHVVETELLTIQCVLGAGVFTQVLHSPPFLYQNPGTQETITGVAGNIAAEFWGFAGRSKETRREVLGCLSRALIAWGPRLAKLLGEHSIFLVSLFGPSEKV